MRRVVLRMCCLLALAGVARGQATWDFTAGTGAASSLPTNVVGGGGTITATNGTLVIAATYVSSGYTGASGGNNASVGAVAGALSTTTSSYFEFTLTATTGNRLFVNSLSLGTRSTASGPTSLALYSSSNGFTSAIGTVAVSANSAWGLVTFSGFSIFGTTGGALTFRVYGSGGTSASAGNWRIDDLSLSVSSDTPGPAIATQPASQTVPPGANVNLSVVAAGTGTVTYQWRKGGTALNNTAYPSATTATLNLGTVVTGDTGSYDVVVTDSVASRTSSAASLTVAITPATVILGSLTATFDGNAHAATVTTSPLGLSTSVTYNSQGAAPTNAGTYAVIATITDPAYTGSATGNLVISPAPQTITFNSNSGFAPAVGVPFTANATASGGTTVQFAIATGGNATASGTNNATITANSTTAFTVNASTAGDANNAASASPATLAVTAIAPVALSGSYTQSFDTLGTAMPAGWHVFSGATATSIGTDVSGVPTSLVLSATDWSSSTINYRNVASALNSGVNSGDSSGAQSAYTNRSLGARQGTASSSTVGDPGAAFGFNFATTNVNVTAVSFSAQIVSSNANATTWFLQSANGATPTSWTTLATFNDPGTFGATTVSVSSSTIGTALNNRTNAWLRVVALSATTFGGTRDTFAIDNFSITVGPVVAISAQPAALTRTSGQSASFSVTAVGTGALTYQWRRNGVAISGNGSAATATLTLASVLAANAGSYDVVVTDSVGSITSSSVALTVNPITTTLAFSNLTATYDGLPHPALATPAPSGATVGPLTYTGVGATFYAASTTAPTNPGTYLVTATVTDADHLGSASDILRIGGASGAVAPVVVAAPATQSVAAGDVVSFTVDATGSPAPTLQWRKDGVAISGATNSTYTILGATLADGGLYDVVVTNSGGSLISSAATLTVAKKAQTITFDAPAGAFNAGTPVKLTATATSGLPVAFTIVSGAGSLVGSTLTGFGATVVVRASQAGTATYAAADNIDRTLTFVAGGLAPFLFGTPTDQTVNLGATITFSASATGTPTPTWQWVKDGVAIDGATKSFLTLASVTLADAARYTVTATNSVGAVSASARLNVRAAPVFTASPSNQEVAAGTNVSLVAVVTGFPAPALQWRKNGVAIRGAVTDKLTLVNVSAGDSARYDVVATNALGAATSATATLTVIVRDFSGAYFGKFAGAAGDFALYMRANGTGVFIGFLPGSKTAIVATNVVVDLSGNFSLSVAATAASAAVGGQLSGAGSDSSFSPPIAAAAQSVTLRGTLNDTTGALTASVPELGVTLDGARAATTGAAAAQAGYYSGALVGSADGRGYVIVGADGQAFALAAASSSVDGATGTVGTNGRLTLTTANQSTIDLGFTNGALSGTVKSAAGVTASLNGATDALAGTERLANISARGGTAPGAPLIAGFVVSGATPKQVLIRAAGPALAPAPFNVAGALDDPVLQLFRGNTVIAQNDNWSAPASAGAAITAAAASVNAFAFRGGSADAALLTTLTPGNYTVQISAGATSANSTGVVLAEIYEIIEAAESPGARRLANLSARGPVAPGTPLIAGFVINGTAPQRVLIRGIGPALTGFNLPGALANPTLTLFRGSTVLKVNDDWFRDPDATLIRDAAVKTGAFALGASSLDAALLLYLEPGAYTAQITASNPNGTGTALVEIYDTGP